MGREEGRYFGGLVFGGGDEVGAVGGHLEVGDLHAVFVGGLVDEEFAGLPAVVRCLVEHRRRRRRRERTFASYWLTVPSSCPAMIYVLR